MEFVEQWVKPIPTYPTANIAAYREHGGMGIVVAPQADPQLAVLDRATQKVELLEPDGASRSFELRDFDITMQPEHLASRGDTLLLVGGDAAACIWIRIDAHQAHRCELDPTLLRIVDVLRVNSTWVVLGVGEDGHAIHTFTDAFQRISGFGRLAKVASPFDSVARRWGVGWAVAVGSDTILHVSDGSDGQRRATWYSIDGTILHTTILPSVESRAIDPTALRDLSDADTTGDRDLSSEPLDRTPVGLRTRTVGVMTWEGGILDFMYDPVGDKTTIRALDTDGAILAQGTLAFRMKVRASDGARRLIALRDINGLELSSYCLSVSRGALSPKVTC